MAMPEVARATVTIIPNMQGSQKKIQEDLGASVSDAGESAGKSLGSKLIGTLGKIGIGAAVGKLVKDSIAEGANLQQSFGGLETLYGDAAETMKNYAFEAAKAGVSANDYAEQAVSFGASLKAAFGGDTKKAAEAANTALMDMTDNAAKMGTPIENIQNAYQGFAKGQYNMLDNLKIGYGGTRTEMERLLADASKLSGVEYNIDNLGDVYEAIHVIQGELGLTGVAAEEASTTFSGSFGAMKAAAANVLGNLALGEDIMPSLQQLGASIKTFLVGNALPMIGNVVQQIPAILANLPAFIGDILPDLVLGVADIVVALAQGIVDNIPTFIEGIGDLVMAIPEALGNIDFGSVASGLLNGLSSAMAGIWGAVTDLFKVTFGVELPDWETLTQDISDLWDKVKTGIADFFKAAFDILTDDDKTITEKIGALWELVKGGIADFFKTVFEVGVPVAETIISAISNWWGDNVWPSIQDFFKTTFGIDLPEWETITEPIKKGWEIVKAGIAGLFKAPFEVTIPTAEEVISAIDGLWTAVWDGITGWFNATFGLTIPTWEEVKESISQFWTDIENGIRDWFKATFNITIPTWGEIKESVESFWKDFKAGIAGWFKKTFNVTMPSWSDIQDKIEQGWEAVKKGIGNIFSWLFSLEFPSIDGIVQDLKDWWGNVVKGVGDFFTLKWIFDDDEPEFKGGGRGKSFELNDDTVNIDSQKIQDALNEADLTLGDIDTASLDTAYASVTMVVSAIEKAFKDADLALPSVKTSALGVAKTAVVRAVASIKETMKFTWSLPTLHGHLPIISVNMRDAKSSDGKTSVSYPELSVSGLKWFAEGGIFNTPTIIGIGDSKGPEAAVPLDQMWKRMSAEFDKHTGGGVEVTNYITVNGAEDPAMYADTLAREIRQQLRMA